MTRLFPLIGIGRYRGESSRTYHLKFLWVYFYFTIVSNLTKQKYKQNWFNKLMSRTGYQTNWAIAFEIRLLKWATKLTLYLVEDGDA